MLHMFKVYALETLDISRSMLQTLQGLPPTSLCLYTWKNPEQSLNDR